MPARKAKLPAGETVKTSRRGPSKAQLAAKEHELFLYAVSAACVENLIAMAWDSTLRAERFAFTRAEKSEVRKLKHIVLTLMERQARIKRRGFD